MNFDLIKRIMHTKVFRALIIFTILYFIGYAIFMIWINPDTTKTPGQPGMFLRRFLVDYILAVVHQIGQSL